MNDFIARTGRVQTWINDPTSRLPISCTVFNVQDSMEGTDGIEASWKFASAALRYGAGVAIHLSDIRPNGTENGKGLTASGPVSFASIYSALNSTIRRGGHYKNGAIVIHLDLNHGDIDEFINASRAELPWVKKCINLTPEMWIDTPDERKERIYKAIQAGDIWLAKIKYDQKGERIRANVCLEVFLKSRGTCLLEHINLGMCTAEDLDIAFTTGMQDLCAMHPNTGVETLGEYLSPEVDRQVGLGMIGLANFLANEGLTYEEFGKALERVNAERGPVNDDSRAIFVANQFWKAIILANQVAALHNMDRAFAIAPTASCSYNYKDLKGFTTTPEIAPPIHSKVDRDSGTFGVESFDYGDVETASQVGWDNYKLVTDNICLLLERTGRFHGYSFNSWSDVVTYDNKFITEWLDSPQTSLYYALQVQPDTLRKDDASAILEDDYADIFNFEEDDNFCTTCAE